MDKTKALFTFNDLNMFDLLRKCRNFYKFKSNSVRPHSNTGNWEDKIIDLGMWMFILRDLERDNYYYCYHYHNVGGSLESVKSNQLL